MAAQCNKYSTAQHRAGTKTTKSENRIHKTRNIKIKDD